MGGMASKSALRYAGTHNPGTHKPGTHEASGHPGHTCCEAHAILPGETLKAADEICRKNGLRMTPQRRSVLEALAEAKHPLGAYDLIETLRNANGRVLAPIAVYRALDFLRENGFIHRLETLNAFIACPHLHSTGEKVIFLICEACRHVEEAGAEALSNALATLAAEHGFMAERQVIELAGTCRNCRSGAA